jgi:SAM-dependent methyltransferase
MTGESGYTLGHGEGALAQMRFRTADKCCAFFREHLRADSRILDCGCGPGSVTVGLAQWAPNGETIGVDLNAGQLEGARALAHSLGVSNVTFRQGDIFDLPFENDAFDCVFSQTVLYHIPDPAKALAEIKRVLRPGGLVALRDAITGSLILWPEQPLIRELLNMLRLGAQRSGGNPEVGRELGTLLHEAGFEDVFMTLGAQQADSPDERADVFSRYAGAVEGDLATLAVSEGWSTAERLAEGAALLRNLANIPGSICAIPYGQAIARKPAAKVTSPA